MDRPVGIPYRPFRDGMTIDGTCRRRDRRSTTTISMMTTSTTATSSKESAGRIGTSSTSRSGMMYVGKEWIIKGTPTHHGSHTHGTKRKCHGTQGGGGGGRKGMVIITTKHGRMRE